MIDAKLARQQQASAMYLVLVFITLIIEAEGMTYFTALFRILVDSATVGTHNFYSCCDSCVYTEI